MPIPLNSSFPFVATWQLDPVLIGGIFAVGLCYGLAVGPLRKRLAPKQAFPRNRAVLFYGGLAVFYLVEGSPLHDIAEIYLFSAHMAQHLALSYVVAPLLLAGMPVWLLRPLLLNRWVRPVARLATHPVVAFLAFNGFFSLWHFPVVYEGALENSFLHHIEHLIFIGTALLVWWPIMSPLPELPRLPFWGRIFYLFLQPVAQLPVFGIVTFAGTPLYPTYALAPRIIGLTPVEDQALGGVIMKVGGLIAFGIPFVLTFFAWYRSEAEPGRRPPRGAKPAAGHSHHG